MIKFTCRHIACIDRPGRRKDISGPRNADGLRRAVQGEPEYSGRKQIRGPRGDAIVPTGYWICTAPVIPSCASGAAEDAVSKATPPVRAIPSLSKHPLDVSPAEKIAAGGLRARRRVSATRQRAEARAEQLRRPQERISFTLDSNRIATESRIFDGKDRRPASEDQRDQPDQEPT